MSSRTRSDSPKPIALLAPALPVLASATRRAIGRPPLRHSRGCLALAFCIPPMQRSLHAAMGAFYRDYGTFYPEGARTAFGGASELARMMVLREASGQPYEQELSRYVLAYAAAAAAYGGGFSASAAPSAPAASTQPAGPPVSVLKPLELPTVDATGLSADQRAQWMELRDQFRSTSARVHEARVVLEQLTRRSHGSDDARLSRGCCRTRWRSGVCHGLTGCRASRVPASEVEERHRRIGGMVDSRACTADRTRKFFILPRKRCAG